MTVLLYPGAGSDSTHPSLVATERWLAPHPCVRADFPYRKQCRKAPDRAPVLLAAIRDGDPVAARSVAEAHVHAFADEMRAAL